MKLARRQFLHLASAAAAIPAFTRGARAQTYPTRAVRMIVPLSAGSAADILARQLATKMSEGWSQPVVVENRPGAGTTIGTDAVARPLRTGIRCWSTPPPLRQAPPSIPSSIRSAEGSRSGQPGCGCSDRRGGGSFRSARSRSRISSISPRESRGDSTSFGPGSDRAPTSRASNSSSRPASTPCMCRTRDRQKRCSTP